MSSLADEVQADVEVQRTESIVSGELWLVIVVAMNDGTHSCKPAGIVPHDAKPSGTIEVEIAEGEVLLNLLCNFQFTFR